MSFNKYWLFIPILLIGLFLKVYRIDQKYFWFDEVSSISHTSGNQFNPPVKNLVLPITVYKDQLRLNKQGYTFGSELKGLFTSVNMNPLHYPLLMIWTRILGDEPVMYRWFNVLMILMTLPILFLLSQKLFNNPMAGWVAITIYATSPYINYFTHEARYHITWAFFIVTTCYLFIKSLDSEKLIWWVGVVVTATCSMYISLISIPTLVGLFLWGTIYYKYERRKIVISFALAFLFYLPWLYWLYINRNEIGTGLAWHGVFGENISVIKLVFLQLFVPAQSFVLPADFMTFNYFGLNSVYVLLMPLLFLLFIVVSIVYSIKNKTKYAGLFLVFVFLPLSMFFVASDFIRGVSASTVHRYQVVNIVGVILFLSYFLSDKMAQGKRTFYAAYILIIGIGIIITIKSVSEIRQTKNGDATIREGKLYSAKESPLIISDFKGLPMGLDYLEFLEVANSIESDNVDIIYASSDIKNIDSLVLSRNYSDVFISFSSDELINNLKMQFGKNIKEVSFDGIAPIWKIDNSYFSKVSYGSR